MRLIEENKMDVNQTEALIPFESPTRITIVAATNMGKTYFVKRLFGLGAKILKNRSAAPPRKKDSIATMH